jgi:hypothetical protein
MKKYEWSSTENAPAKYPMQILKGNYVLEDDEIPVRLSLSINKK